MMQLERKKERDGSVRDAGDVQVSLYIVKYMSPSKSWLTSSYTRQTLIYTGTRSGHVERISNCCSRLWMSSSVKKTELPDCDSDIDLADKFSEYFVDKISKIRKNLDLNSPKSPEKTSKHVEKDTSASMTSFTPTTISEIWKIIRKSASKSCSSDPVLTWLLKEHLDVLLPVITDIVNMSLESGVFPDEMKHAMIKPLLKKSGLDPNLLKKFSPISNLTYLSKIIERVVASRLSTQMNENNLAEPM